MEDLTWKCEICGEERPDAKISVLTYKLKALEPVDAQRNVKYCNDKESCYLGAVKLSNEEDEDAIKEPEPVEPVEEKNPPYEEVKEEVPMQFSSIKERIEKISGIELLDFFDQEYEDIEKLCSENDVVDVWIMQGMGRKYLVGIVGENTRNLPMMEKICTLTK